MLGTHASNKKALGIAGVYTEVNAWQCSKDNKEGIQGSQIDCQKGSDNKCLTISIAHTS